jgi:hypothetical protein
MGDSGKKDLYGLRGTAMKVVIAHGGKMGFPEGGKQDFSLCQGIS